MLDLVLVLLVLTNFELLGSSRLRGCIRTVSVQGVLLGVLPLVAGTGGLTLSLALIALTSAVLKGLIFPWMLLRALREARVKREVEPFVGYNASVLFGVLSLAGCVFLSWRLPLPVPELSELLVPVAFSTILVGLFVIVSRRKALTQVLGYLVFENGIYCFGVAILYHAPLLVELGLLLDLLVAVFVMGITIFHISQTFDSIDTERLASLKE
ncbi:MAG: hydrogenase [Candidatus Eremiobacterota bacterium]